MHAYTIAFVESTARMGGVEFSTLYLVQHLGQCWKAFVICPEDGDLPLACRSAGVPVYILPHLPLHSTSIGIGNHWRLPNPAAWVWDLAVVFQAARGLAPFLAQARPDLVVTKGMFSHFYGGLAAKWLGIPCIWHVQDFVSERFFGIYRRIFGLVARWLPDHVIVDGGPIAWQLPQALQERITVIHNGVDTEVFRPDVDGREVRQELGIPSDALVIGHVARMTPWKGQHHLLEAFLQIAPEFPKAYLLFVGSSVLGKDTYEHRLRRRALESRFSDRVIFAGFRNDLPQVLAAMDIFVFTSVEKDTSPLAFLSAMAAGKPIIATSIPGVRELVRDGVDVLLVAPGDVSGLSKALRHILTDASLRARLGKEAREKAVREFSVQRFAQRCCDVFRSVLAAHLEAC
jgi:glycosyltransferase involved in cell wall biosynthesis